MSWTGSGAPNRVVYPDGLLADRSYDETGAAVGLVYASGGVDLLGFTNTLDVDARTVAATSPASAQRYSYDTLGRLVTVQDIRVDTTDTPACTTRVYGFSAASERTSLTTYGPASNAGCQTSTPATTTSSTYDAANRITNTGYTYDNLGRTLTIPAADTNSPTAGALTAGYYANDMIKSLQQGTGTVDYGLDPTGRITAITNKTSGTETSRLRYRFSNNSDSPTSIQESTNTGATWTTTHYIGIPGVGTTASITPAGVLEFHLPDLHGSVIGQQDSGSGVSGILDYAEPDEYGRASQPAAGRYGWLGTSQRSSDALAGQVLMGRRVYNPTSGQFLSVDPVEGGNQTPYSYPEDPVNQSDPTGEYGYLFYYHLDWKPWQSPESVFSSVRGKFKWLFTFPNNCDLYRGERCSLWGGKPMPVLVAWVSSTSFTFLSQPGHAEGAGKSIRFSIFRSFGQHFLRVHAWGPDVTRCDRNAICASLNRSAAFGFWLTFSIRIRLYAM